jgi:hypothetical protein
MDHIDETLTNNSLDPELEPSIRAALRITKKTLNKYYDATDQSEVYRIAMGTCSLAAPDNAHHHCLLIFQSYILATNSNTLSALVGSQIGSRQPKR